MFDVDRILDALKNDPKARGQVAAGGGAALAASMLMGRRGRKLMGKAAQYGAIAAIGGLAYHAWRNREGAPDSGQQRAGQQDAGASQDYGPPPADSGFLPPKDEAAEDALGKALVRAMIAAAKADGKIDAEEKERIFARLNAMDLDADAKAFVFDELSAPLDINAVVAGATRPETAAEIYAASLVAIEADTPAERAYLDMLAARLDLDPALTAEIHRAAEAG